MMQSPIVHRQHKPPNLRALLQVRLKIVLKTRRTQADGVSHPIWDAPDPHKQPLNESITTSAPSQQPQPTPAPKLIEGDEIDPFGSGTPAEAATQADAGEADSLATTSESPETGANDDVSTENGAENAGRESRGHAPLPGRNRYQPAT